MISHIHIKNFTIIDHLALDFPAGMLVLTGETGAGKSIVVDAMELALGKRVTADVIRAGCDEADISLYCDIAQNTLAQDFLAEYDLHPSEECLIRRVIKRDGPSKSYINNIPTTLETVRALGETLVNIHGQHEFQTLLKRDEQRRLLDQFAEHLPLLSEIEKLYHAWQETYHTLEKLKQSAEDTVTRTEFLAYQIQELDALDLSEEEIQTIDQEYKQLAHADELISQCQTASNALDSETQEPTALTLLNQAALSLSSLQNLTPQLANIADTIGNAILNAQEATHELGQYVQTLEPDPERLAHLENRIAKIHDLARKHKVEPEELPALQMRMQEELDQLENSDQKLQALEDTLADLTKKYATAAAKLTKSRTKSAKKLSALVTHHIQQLGMPHGQFQIAFEPLETPTPTTYGREKINFQVAINPGQPFQPLNKVASGGELSRISLAIQVITAQKNQTPTLIFDEVDIGIGGATAEIVGKLLQELAKATQVCCITHLPQVAAKGHHHFQVEKIANASSTKTCIKTLNTPERISELARMLGGVNITQQTLAHAKEMLESAT